MLSHPVVSCIMPTRNRRLFVEQSIRYFLRQVYLRCELIIVDDGEEAVADLLPGDARVRYIHLEDHLSLGAKRNIACSMSQGDFIAHWDDDDWMAADRLTIQVSELLSSGADICGLRDLVYYRPEFEDAWLYRYPTHERPWVAGCTLLYRRDVWAGRHFPAIDVGEDSAFVFQSPSHHIHAVVDISFYIALIHPGNTGAKNLADSHWQPYSLEKVQQVMEADRDFYAALSDGYRTQRLMR